MRAVLAANPDSEVRTLDPRDPEVRVAARLDQGTVAPLRPADSSGVYTVRGRIDGVKVIVYCTDATAMGGAMGTDGCRHIVEAIDVASRVTLVLRKSFGGAYIAMNVRSLAGPPPPQAAASTATSHSKDTLSVRRAAVERLPVGLTTVSSHETNSVVRWLRNKLAT
jgi:hypothetical protein